MKQILLSLFKNIILQIVSFSIILGLVAFAINFPSTPDGQISGGKFQSYFSKMLLSCPTGETLKGFQTNGEKICGLIGENGIEPNAINQTHVENGYIDKSSSQTILGKKNFSSILGAGKIQINDIINENTSCSNNGLLARTASGVLLSCIDGIWKSAQSTGDIVLPPTTSVIECNESTKGTYGWNMNTISTYGTTCVDPLDRSMCTPIVTTTSEVYKYKCLYIKNPGLYPKYIYQWTPIEPM